MSTLITLRLPMFDRECLELAIKECGATFQKAGQGYFLNEGIELMNSTGGCIAKVDGMQKQLVDRIHGKYKQIYEEKVRKLRESQKALDYLEEQLELKKKRLQQMLKRGRGQASAETEHLNTEMATLEAQRVDQQETTQKIQEEYEAIEKTTQAKVGEIIETIKEKAKESKYSVSVETEGGQTRLVLVRRMY